MSAIFCARSSYADCKELSAQFSEPAFQGYQLAMNKRYYFAVHEGNLCIKRKKNDAKWHAVKILPEMKGVIAEIALDGGRLAARGHDNRIFLMKKADEKPKDFTWTAQWGVPLGHGAGLWLPSDTVLWGFSFLSPRIDKYYTDSMGQDHAIGVGVTSLYAVRGDRQTINYFDPWLPSDTSYQVCGPMRGRLRIEAMSAAGSTLAVMDKYGNIFVRRHDFDIVGGNKIIIGYTYHSPKPRDNSLYWWRSPRKLPVPDYELLPKIDGQITNRISLIKVGHGAKLRYVRVEGMKDGVTGYFEADFNFIERSPHRSTVHDAIVWKFIRTNEPIIGTFINTQVDSTELDLGDSRDQQYRSHKKDKKYYSYLELMNFNTHCSPSILRVHTHSRDFVDVILHTREKIRVARRSLIHDDKPLLQTGVIEVPKDTLKNYHALSKEQRKIVKYYFHKQRFSKAKVKVSLDKVAITFGQVRHKHHWKLIHDAN